MFKAPEGFVLPEGKKNGDTFSVLAEFKIYGDKLCLTSIDEMEVSPIGDKEEEGETETEQAYNKNVDGMMG